ncbi:MAG: hypothetical protein K940chlam7_01586 [Chlamydiae bacterium]|nr:hypothetical protein [Chlamydiota bacterium]
MTFSLLAVLTYQDIVYFGAALSLVFLALSASFYFGWWMSRRSVCPCPYTGHPLRLGSDLRYYTIEKVLRFLYDMHDYNNRMFDLNHAAVCRETGRIFSEAITWYDRIKVDWNFLQKRYPGKFVSWGSLSVEQKVIIKDKHHSLKGFQTEFSSPTPSPRQIAPEYIYTKPGPLYVDIDTGVLLGWKIVPDTELEVLIVQKPVEEYLPGIHKKY